MAAGSSNDPRMKEREEEEDEDEEDEEDEEEAVSCFEFKLAPLRCRFTLG